MATILIVEDDAVIGAHLSETLACLGYATAGPCATGEEAVAAAGALGLDLVLMDIGLTGAVDGIDAARQLRAQFDLPVVFLTAHADAATLARAKLAEPLGYLTKPCSAPALQAALETALHKHLMDRRLRESETLFRNFVQQASDAFVLTDEAGRVAVWNGSAERLTGRTAAAAIGRPLAEIQYQLLPAGQQTPDGQALLQTTMHTALQTGAAPFIGQPLEAVYQHADGQRKAVVQHAFSIRTARGYRLGFTIRDDTQRRQAEQEREWALALLSERIKEQGLLYNVSRLLQSDTRPVPEVLQAVVGLVPAGWQYPEITAARLTWGAAAWATPNFAVSSWRQSAAWITASGQRGELEVVYREPRPAAAEGPFLAEERTLLTALAEMLQGFIERRLALDEIQQLNVRLEHRVAERTAALTQALRVKDEFLAAMSHELRTPLTGMLGLTEVLAQEIYGPVTDRQRHSLAHIAASGQRLLTLIEDLLDLTQLEAGQLELHLGPVSAAEIGHASWTKLAAAAAAQGVRLVGPDLEPNVVVVTDGRRLRQMLGHLLANAIKFTPAGGQVSLRLQTDLTRAAVSFVIQDTGIGIAAADQSRVFQPFVQLDARLERQYEGAGLGLALVRRLAEALGGTVSVVSAGVPGQGSCFTLTLPWEPPAVSSR